MYTRHGEQDKDARLYNSAMRAVMEIGFGEIGLGAMMWQVQDARTTDASTPAICLTPKDIRKRVRARHYLYEM